MSAVVPRYRAGSPLTSLREEPFSPDILWNTDRTVEGTTQERSAAFHGTEAVRFYVIDFANSRFRESGEKLDAWEDAKQEDRENAWVETGMICAVERALKRGCELHGTTCVSDYDDDWTPKLWEGYSPERWGRFPPYIDPWSQARANADPWASDSEHDDEAESRSEDGGPGGASEGEEGDEEGVHQVESAVDGHEEQASSASEEGEDSEDYGITTWHGRLKRLVWASPRIPLQSKVRKARPAEVPT